MDLSKASKIFSSSQVFQILELFLLISQIGLSSSQGHLSGVQDGQVHFFDRSRPNVLTPDSHVDLPGEHGNRSPHPVIHRHSGAGSHVSNIAHSQQHGNNFHTNVNGMVHGTSTAHVDLPGQHGNNSPFPAVHRQAHGSHVDLPGQHGNDSPFPAVHRQHGFHVDLPGQHGNDSPFPSVHRQHGSHVDLLGQHGHSSSHVDFPGQHGNDSPFPAVHRQPGSHVDLPGQHGNESPHPAVHRDTHAPGSHHHASERSGAGRQSFLDPVSGTPVVISAPSNTIPRLPTDHLDTPDQPIHSHSLDAVRGTRPVPLPMIIRQPPLEPPLGIPLMPLPIGVPVPRQRGLGRPFGGPILPVPLGPPPLIVPPEVGLMGRYRGLMRRPLIMSRLPAHFLPLPPPSSLPRRIRLGDIIAGVIGSLFRGSSRQ